MFNKIEMIIFYILRYQEKSLLQIKGRDLRKYTEQYYQTIMKNKFKM